MRTCFAVAAALILSTLSTQAYDADSLPSPDTLDIIRNADAVYVFPSTSPTKYRRNDAHMRLLGPEARDKLVRLLGDDRNWYHGLLTFGDWPEQAANVGFVFRRGKDELVLFFSEVVIYGTFRGHRLVGDLEDKVQPQMSHWKRRYASTELQTK
jgi:hypothetical protein